MNDQSAQVETLVEDSPSGAGEQFNVLPWLHSLLRGRYWIAVPLMLIGIAAGGWGGYAIQRPLYRSNGMMRVKPILPKILYQNEQNGVMPFFESFISSQVSLLSSQRVIDLAMQDSEWQALGRGLSPEAVASFTRSLEAVSTRSELIVVSFKDEDPRAAMIAVRSVIEAYQKLYGENESEGSVQRMEVLEARRTALTNEQKSLKDRIQALANEYGSASLDDEYRFRAEELNKTESRLKELQLAIAEAEGGFTTTRPTAVTLDMVAAIDPLMRAYLAKKQESELQAVSMASRLGENHKLVAEERAYIQRLDEQIDSLMKSHRAEDVHALLANGTPDGNANLERMKLNEAKIRALFEQEKAKTLEIGRKNVQLNNLAAEAESVKAKLDEVKDRIEQLNVEGSISGRISVLSFGDKPLGPDKDRRKALAAAGACGGGALGLALVVLFGVFDPRVRHISDTRDSSQGACRLLGVLPNLRPDFADAEQVVIAAHGVHQIRSMLERDWIPESCRCIAVTSSSPGAGKTSLTAALGVSFAASGSKTLLIDCDIVGGGLTSAMNRAARERIGQILCRQGRLTSSQIDEIKAMAARCNLRFGEAAMELGLIKEHDVTGALAAQTNARVGLREALNGRPLVECVVKTKEKRLFLLPLGSAGHHHVGQLSANALRQLINEARQRFDFILVDTGPILGSVEARMVATVVDETILVVPRGEQRSLIHRATEHLREVGANVSGIVFNRAREADIASSGFSSSASRHDEQHRPLALPDDRRSRLGPIATAVASMTESQT